jgi:hypothetical protein
MRSRPEQAIQAAVVEYLRLALPGALVFAVPNQEKRPVPGMYAGMTDLVIHDSTGQLPGRAYVGFMEVKSATGKLRPEQEKFRDRCRDAWIPWACVRSVNDAERALVAWGWKPRATAGAARSAADADLAERGRTAAWLRSQA